MEDCELALQLMRQDAARGAFNATKCAARVFSMWGDGDGLGKLSFPVRKLGWDMKSVQLFLGLQQ